MKIVISVFAVCLLVLSVGFIYTDDKIIEANGIASLSIGVSTLKDIKITFPAGKREVKKRTLQGHSHVLLKSGECKEIIGRKHTVRFVSYIDKDNGLEFYLGKDDVLKNISFSKPTKYKTNKGIGIGDHFYELDSLYGKTKWIRHISGNCKMNGNLKFFPADSITKATLTTEELEALDTHNVTIDKIVLIGNTQ